MMTGEYSYNGYRVEYYDKDLILRHVIIDAESREEAVRKFWEAGIYSVEIYSVVPVNVTVRREVIQRTESA